MDGENNSQSGDSENSGNGDSPAIDTGGGAGNEGGTSNESGNEGNSDGQEQGSDWTTTFESYNGGTFEGAAVTATRESQSDSESGYGFSNFDSRTSTGSEGSDSDNDSSTDINIPSSLIENISQKLPFTDALVRTAENAIEAIEKAHKVAKIDIPKNLENIIEKTKTGANAYNLASYTVKYINAVKDKNYRKAGVESVNALLGIGVSTISLAIPVAGIPLGIIAYAMMEHYDVGGQIYDGMDSLDIGVRLYDFIHDENP